MAIVEGMVAYYVTLNLTFCSILRKWTNIKKQTLKYLKSYKELDMEASHDTKFYKIISSTTLNLTDKMLLVSRQLILMI
jgi:hypothetical protein